MIPHVVVSFVVSNSRLVAFVSIYLRLLSFALTQHLSVCSPERSISSFQLNQRQPPSSLNPTQFQLRTLDLI